MSSSLPSRKPSGSRDPIFRSSSKKASSHVSGKRPPSPDGALKLTSFLSSPEFKLQTIMQSLSASSTLVVDEKKKAEYLFDPALLALGRSVLGNWRCKFRTSRGSRLTSGSGTLAVIVSCDLASQSEGACLTALFDECRGLSTTIQLLGNSNGSPVIAAYIGFEPIVSTVTPTVALVSRLPGSHIVSTWFNPSPTIFTRSYGPGRQWGLTSDEGVSAPRIASGMNGNWSVASDNTFSTPASSYPYFGYLLNVSAEFRNRG